MGGRARSCRSRAYRTALPFVIAPLIDALVERGELEEAARWPALTGLEAGWPEEFGFTFLLDSLARLRLAQGRVPGGAAPRARVRPPPARVGDPQSRLRRVAARRSPPRSPRPAARPRRSTRATSRSTSRARFGVAREEGMALTALGRDHRRRGAAARRGRGAGALAGAARARPRAARARRARAAARRRSSSPSAAARPRSPPARATHSSRPAPGRAAHSSPAPPRSPPRSCASRSSPPAVSATARSPRRCS